MGSMASEVIKAKTMPVLNTAQLVLPALRIKCDLDLDEIDTKLDFIREESVKEKQSIEKSYKCKCQICFKKFLSLRKLYIHEKSHLEAKKSHQCNICDRTFIHKSSLLLHSKNHRKPNEVKVDEPQESIKANEKCNEVPKIVEEPPKIIEEVPEIVEVVPEIIPKSPEILQDKYLCICRGCNQHITEEELFLHRLKCTFTCKNCNEIFYNYNRFLEHNKICSDTSSCAKTLIEMSEKPVEFTVKPLVEPQSESVKVVPVTRGKIRTPRILKQKSKWEKKSKREFYCKFCGKFFDRIGHCLKHERTHTGETPYDCDFCDRKFRQLGNKRRHIKEMHIGDKLYVCDKCGKKFARLDHLRRHSTVFCLKAQFKREKLQETKNKPNVQLPTIRVVEPMKLIQQIQQPLVLPKPSPLPTILSQDTIQEIP